jgi:hypothetical protein
MEIDSKLLKEARQLGKHRTYKEALDTALREYIKRQGQMQITEVFGTVDYDTDYDYKAERHRKVV